MMTSHKSNCPSYKALIAVERKFCYEKLPMPAAQCVIPENIHTPHHGSDFFEDTPQPSENSS